MQNIHLSISAKSKNPELFRWSFQAWKKYPQNIQYSKFSEFYNSMCRAMLGYDFVYIPYNTRRAKKRLALTK
jgi:hypothetical protein